MISEFTAIDWLGRGWLLLLAFTVAVLLVAALRKPCRCLFGTERAFQLWLLPPLAMLVSQLPHAAVLGDASRQPAVFAYTAAAIELPMHMARVSSMDWRSSALLLWILGMALNLLLGFYAQARYRAHLRGATSIVTGYSRQRVLRATRTDVGPALVGAWWPCIVLPRDFEQRYGATEQRLILAHECMHARRGDGWWCLLARVMVALFWFHPLAWWALSALRHDQELACDAAVLREHGAQRRSYANAMLKTQSAGFALPVGCPWSPRHPVTERIEMLKNPLPKPLRRLAGLASLVGLLVGTSAVVYAAQRTTTGFQATAEAVKEGIALTDGAKTAVAFYAFKHDFGMPADNDVAELAPADLMSGKFVRRVSVQDGTITVELRAQPDGLTTAGSLRLIPRVDQAKKRIGWSCESSDIVNIQDLEAACIFKPAGSAVAHSDVDAKTSSSDTAADVKEYQFNMSLLLATDDAKSSHTRRASVAVCAEIGKTAQLRVRDFEVNVLAIPGGADSVIMNLDAGGSDGQGKYLAVRRKGVLGQALHLEGNVAAGKNHFSLEVTPQVGCPARVLEQTRSVSHT